MNRILKISVGLFLILFLGILIGCQNNQTKTFKVGIATWPGFAPGFIAKEKGYFDNLEVEFIIIDDFSARQNAFTSGQTQATISTLDSYAFESGQGVEGKVIMILDESYGADAIVAKPEINNAKDLVGKKVAFTRGSPAHFFLKEYLKKNGISMDSIKTVEVDDPGRAGEAFVSGDVDAAVTWEPNISQIVNSGKGKVIESTKTSPGLIVDVMVVSLKAYDSRKGDIQTFVDGWLKAVQYIEANQKDAYSIMAKRMNIPIEEFPAMAEGLRFADKERNRELLLPSGESKAIVIFNKATKVWVADGLISKPQFGEELITAEFID